MRAIGTILFLAIGLSWATPALAQESLKKMSIKEMGDQAKSLIDEMRVLKDRAEARLRQARSDKDLERMDCINEALIAMKGVLNLAESYYYDLQAKAQGGKTKQVRAELNKIRISSTKVHQLDAQIRSCGGPADQGIIEGKPVIEWSKDKDLPSEDPVAELEFGEVYLDRPSIQSPYH